jgi:hypothetical protein
MHTARLCPEHALQQDKIRYDTIRYDKYAKVKPFDEKRRDLKLGTLFSSHLFCLVKGDQRLFGLNIRAGFGGLITGSAKLYCVLCVQVVACRSE